MDPVTAALQALNSFNQVLLTPPGQKLLADAEQVVIDVLSALHVHIAPDTTPPTGK